VEAQLAAAGVLVVLEAFEPGWVATVDAAPAPVLRANGLFRAVRLEAGRHRVRFAYRPRSVAYGAAISASGLAAALGLAGAVAFGASDTLIAFDRFAAPIPRVRWPIMVLYWLGQSGIAASAVLGCGMLREKVNAR